MLYSLTLRNKQNAVRNGQSRDTGNIGHRIKTNKTRNITQKTKDLSKRDPTK